MVEKRNDMFVAIAIDAAQLCFSPAELRAVFRNVRVECEHERVAVTKRIRRISVEPARCALRRNEVAHRGEVVREAARTLRRLEITERRHIMIAGGEEVG